MLPRRREDWDWGRADAWLGLISFLLVLFILVLPPDLVRPARAVYWFLILIQPYVLLRVIRHFRHVPRGFEYGAIAVALLGTGVVLALPRPQPWVVLLTAGLYLSLMQLVASAVVIFSAWRYRGLTAWRLNVLAIGSLAFIVKFVVASLAYTQVSPLLFISLLPAIRWLFLITIAGYYFGLVPPRRVRRWLQRGEEYRFLRRSAERSPEDRGRFAAAGLAEAARRATTAAEVIVALGTDTLTIRGASRPEWIGLTAVPSTGAGRALAAGTATSDAIARLEPEWRAVGAQAERFLALPIVSDGRTWGVLVITQRRSSLFPADDIASLSRLCRDTADILDHAKLIADERARQQREADARLDLILESLQDYAVITIDDAGAITSWNVGAEQMFLYPAAEAVGLPVSRLFDDGAPWLKEQLQRLPGSARPIPDTTGRRRDDIRLTTTVVIRPLQTRSGRPSGFVIVMRDVSHRRLLEERLRQSQKLEAIGRLAGGIAHDFNNMLTVILGYASTLDESVAEEHRGSVAEILKAGDRAATLTRQLLTFSRQQVVSPRIVTLREIVANVLPMLTRLLGENIEIVQDVNLNVPSIMADPTQLEQVLVNLAVNARDAMPSGGTLTIRVSGVTLTGDDAASLTGRPGAHARLDVIDTGSGVSPATQARMFEPFFTTKDVGRGTGLGLAMVYGTVQQMHGAITFESELGHGTMFSIYVPAHVTD